MSQFSALERQFSTRGVYDIVQTLLETNKTLDNARKMWNKQCDEHITKSIDDYNARFNKIETKLKTLESLSENEKTFVRDGKTNLTAMVNKLEYNKINFDFEQIHQAHNLQSLHANIESLQLASPAVDVTGKIAERMRQLWNDTTRRVQGMDTTVKQLALIEIQSYELTRQDDESMHDFELRRKESARKQCEKANIAYKPNDIQIFSGQWSKAGLQELAHIISESNINSAPGIQLFVGPMIDVC